mmetsp:Transcript_37452/g.120376  ORF Transcript_37452/g.120376 Transcript_37452/m.120376 type:complete len:238 (-) Transcript_37452:752-1465(-)
MARAGSSASPPFFCTPATLAHRGSACRFRQSCLAIRTTLLPLARARPRCRPQPAQFTRPRTRGGTGRRRCARQSTQPSTASPRRECRAPPTFLARLTTSSATLMAPTLPCRRAATSTSPIGRAMNFGSHTTAARRAASPRWASSSRALRTDSGCRRPAARSRAPRPRHAWTLSSSTFHSTGCKSSRAAMASSTSSSSPTRIRHGPSVVAGPFSAPSTVAGLGRRTSRQTTCRPTSTR